MTLRAQNFFSPRSSSGSFLLSILAHATFVALLIFLLNIKISTPKAPDEFVDLGYQTFDEPPAPSQEEKKVMRSAEPTAPIQAKVAPAVAHELQDEKSDVSGAQEALKQQSHVGNDSDGQAASTPYYKIKPKYPRAALVAGTEGWVMMKIDINENGEVANVRVVDGEQRNLFASEAKRAVSQWKYKPFLDGSGKPFRKADHQVRVDFKLTDAGTSDL